MNPCETVRKVATQSVYIVIPTFNRANLLPRAINSALAQTVSCEVIVCDHGSTDSTPEVARGYGSRIKYIRKEKDEGPIACWRDGIENASGELVHLNYDDDWIDPLFIERTLPLLQPDVAFVYTRVRLHYEGTSLTGGLLAHPSGIRPAAEIARFLLRNRLTISPGCALFRRNDLLKNLLSEVPGADGIYGKKSGVGEDLLLFLLGTLDYLKYAHLPEELSHFLAHPLSITIRAKISGKDQALKAAYGKAKAFYLKQPGNLGPETQWASLMSAIRWWSACGVLNHLRAVISFLIRRAHLVLQSKR